jgi:hypothetical protein
MGRGRGGSRRRHDPWKTERIARDQEAEQMRDASSTGGTMDSTAFRTRNRNDGSGKRDVWFNSPGDGAAHGHVVERDAPDGSRSYDYVRDVEGNEYGN